MLMSFGGWMEELLKVFHAAWPLFALRLSPPMGFENFTIQTWWILASTNWISAMNDGLGRVRRWSIPQNINFDGTYDNQS
jgi:hypothetical protein